MCVSARGRGGPENTDYVSTLASFIQLSKNPRIWLAEVFSVYTVTVWVTGLGLRTD